MVHVTSNFAIRQIPSNFVADSSELPHSELQNVCAVFAECPCSVHRMSVLYPHISVLSAAYLQSDWFAKSPIVVAKETIVSQVANCSH